ncbi:hypothetical protein Tco_1542047 [Tanacetum coccineum]
MKIMKLRQNAVKKPRQNAVKNEILPELLSIKMQYGLQVKRNGGLEQNAVILKQNAIKYKDLGRKALDDDDVDVLSLELRFKGKGKGNV